MSANPVRCCSLVSVCMILAGIFFLIADGARHSTDPYGDEVRNIRAHNSSFLSIISNIIHRIRFRVILALKLKGIEIGNRADFLFLLSFLYGRGNFRALVQPKSPLPLCRTLRHCVSLRRERLTVQL